MKKDCWTPAKMMQGADRCHRIGQKNNVLIKYIVLENSLDSKMSKMLIKKQKIIHKTLDNDI